MIQILKDKIKRYVWNILIALDQIINATFGGYPDETFSSRVHRKAEAGQWFWKLLRSTIDAIFFWQKNHCQAAFQSEQLRRHSPAELAN